ncbi:hypothetical protein BGV40_03840 [Methanosarcina sp. Ant1]|nr:hypothetical protein BGV40_03840 [Methanosarcina sp. Ant1]
MLVEETVEELVLEEEDDIIIGLEQVFPKTFEVDPFEIITKIETEMSQLISDEILSEESTFIYIVERRALNLIHPFLNSIIDHHNVGFIRVNRDDKIQIRQNSNDGSKCIVLTDAIRRGEEISKIIRFLTEKNIKILKVCGYLACRKNVERVKKEFPTTKFIFVHNVEASEEYNQYHVELIPIHQSRIEPLDSEHPYYTYNILPKINKLDAPQIIQALCGSTPKDDDKLRSCGVIGYTVEFEEINTFENLKVIRQIDDLKIERLLLRFRLDISKSLLRIMAFCPVNPGIIEQNQKSCHIKKIIPKKNAYCKLLEKSNKMMCPICLDTNLSLLVLEEINGRINLFNNESNYTNNVAYNYVMKNIGKYNPFQII